MATKTTKTAPSTNQLTVDDLDKELAALESRKKEIRAALLAEREDLLAKLAKCEERLGIKRRGPRKPKQVSRTTAAAVGFGASPALDEDAAVREALGQ